ncbi:MAG: hypothetical protein N2376_09915 [Clostridia bacterium]|nr:hypothetical protein [Clostridia bacterium]
MIKFRSFKFDKGWKLLVYCDLLLPAALFLLAWLSKLPPLSKLFHAYMIYVISPIPNIGALAGLIGIVLHFGCIGYALSKKDVKDLAACLVISLVIVLFFIFGINYAMIKPLEFASF